MIKAIFLTLLGLFYTGLSHAGEYIKCDSATVNFEFIGQKQGVKTIMIISRDDMKTILIYADGIDYIGAECRPNNIGKKYIVYQAYCGGSGCHDLDNYGIIDPINLKVLLVPNDWNSKDADRIFKGKLTRMKAVLSVEKHGKLVTLDK